MTISTEDQLLAGMGEAIPIFKTSSSNKAPGVPHAAGLIATGFPPAFTPGTPGLSGATVDGTTNTLGGTFPFINGGTGISSYLAKVALCIGATTTGIAFFDLIWYNSGISVTTTTAQTINSVTLPARDSNGATSGAGVYAWIYVSSATTATNTTATISYTNSSGTSGKTGTITLGGIPGTATAGTFIPFSLASGDVGIQSIQSITLGTSLTAGTINLMLIRDICFCSFIGPSTGFTYDWASIGFPNLYNGTALSFYAIPTSTTVGQINGSLRYAQG